MSLRLPWEPQTWLLPRGPGRLGAVRPEALYKVRRVDLHSFAQAEISLCRTHSARLKMHKFKRLEVLPCQRLFREALSRYCLRCSRLTEEPKGQEESATLQARSAVSTISSRMNLTLARSPASMSWPESCCVYIYIYLYICIDCVVLYCIPLYDIIFYYII